MVILTLISIPILHHMVDLVVPVQDQQVINIQVYLRLMIRMVVMELRML